MTALLIFQASNEAYRAPQPDPSTAARICGGISGFFGTGRRASDAGEVDAVQPPIPPKPAPKIGMERVANEHAIRAAQGEGEGIDGSKGVEAFSTRVARA